MRLLPSLILALLLACTPLARSLGVEGAGDEAISEIARTFIKEIAKTKPTLSTIEISLALSDQFSSARGALASKLELNAPTYIKLGVADTAEKAQIAYRSYWAALVYACLIDHPIAGRKILSQIIGNPKMPPKIKAWIFSTIAEMSTGGISWSWIEQEPALVAIQDIAKNDMDVWQHYSVALDIKNPSQPIKYPIGSRLVAALALRAIFNTDFGPDFNALSRDDETAKASRTAAMNRIGEAVIEATPRARLNTNTQLILRDWPRYSFGPQQRLALARIHIGSLRADIACLQDFALFALSESARKPTNDPDLVHEYLDAVRRIHESDVLLKNVGVKPPPPEDRIPDCPNDVSIDTTRSWLLAAINQISKRVVPHSQGGMVAAEFEAAISEIERFQPK